MRPNSGASDSSNFPIALMIEPAHGAEDLQPIASAWGYTVTREDENYKDAPIKMMRGISSPRIILTRTPSSYELSTGPLGLQSEPIRIDPPSQFGSSSPRLAPIQAPVVTGGQTCR
jgi:hypothetical protein